MDELLTSHEKLICLILKKYKSDIQGDIKITRKGKSVKESRIPQSKIAQLANMSTQTVKRCVKTLEKKKIISVLRQPGMINIYFTSATKTII